MQARSGDGLSVPGHLGIYTPLRQHSQCGENNVQSKNEIQQKEKRENLQVKIGGPMVSHEKGGA
jgi:hypothetical protein